MEQYENLEIKDAVILQTASEVALLNTKFELIDASERWLSLVGLRADNTKGKNWFKIFPDLSKDWKIRMEHVVHGVKDVTIIDKIVMPNGEIKYFTWHLNPWSDSSGEQYGISVGIVRQ